MKVRGKREEEISTLEESLPFCVSYGVGNYEVKGESFAGSKLWYVEVNFVFSFPFQDTFNNIKPSNSSRRTRPEC